MRSTYFRIATLCLPLCLLFASGSTHALEGTGYGSNPDEACRRAAADLAAAIQVQVKSVVESCTQIHNKQAQDCGSRVLNRTAADLPMLGLHYLDIPGGNEPAGAKALLEAGNAAKLYQEKLASLRKEFAAGAAALITTRDRKARHDLLTRQLATLRAFTDHRMVAIALGLQVEDLPATETDLSNQRDALEQTVDSIAFAARVLLKDINGKLPEAAALTASSNSREATPLGAALADALRAEMSGRSGPKLTLTGEYRLLTEGKNAGDVDIVVELRKEASHELGVRSVHLARAGYEGYRAEPLAPDFEKLLREGAAVSGGLRADLVTSVGAQQIKFKRGDTVKLAARVNRAAYFYVVGHVVRADSQFSYLLPLQSGAANDPSEERFIRYVPADQANHYVDMGEFSVEAPFGTEHAQIIASTQPPKNALPAVRYDPASGYFVLIGSKGDAREGVNKTRGLKPIPDNQVMVAEGTLSFTTSER